MRFGQGTDAVSEHFSHAELVRNRRGLANEPDATALHNAQALAQGVLEPLRSMVGPLGVDSWYRNAEVNAAAGGVARSLHQQGLAADVVSSEFSNRELAAYLYSRTDLPLGEVIWYHHKSHVHVSYDPTRRRTFREARKGAGGGDELRPWSPEPGEVNDVLEKIAGGAPDAGGSPSRGPDGTPLHPMRRAQVQAQASGGGGVLLLGVALVLGASLGGGARRRPSMGRSKRRG